jgi:hypothetical protein
MMQQCNSAAVQRCNQQRDNATVQPSTSAPYRPARSVARPGPGEDVEQAYPVWQRVFSPGADVADVAGLGTGLASLGLVWAG